MRLKQLYITEAEDKQFFTKKELAKFVPKELLKIDAEQLADSFGLSFIGIMIPKKLLEDIISKEDMIRMWVAIYDRIQRDPKTLVIGKKGVRIRPYETFLDFPYDELLKESNFNKGLKALGKYLDKLDIDREFVKELLKKEPQDDITKEEMREYCEGDIVDFKLGIKNKDAFEETLNTMKYDSSIDYQSPEALSTFVANLLKLPNNPTGIVITKKLYTSKSKPTKAPSTTFASTHAKLDRWHYGNDTSIATSIHKDDLNELFKELTKKFDLSNNDHYDLTANGVTLTNDIRQDISKFIREHNMIDDIVYSVRKQDKTVKSSQIKVAVLNYLQNEFISKMTTFIRKHLQHKTTTKGVEETEKQRSLLAGAVEKLEQKLKQKQKEHDDVIKTQRLHKH